VRLNRMRPPALLASPAFGGHSEDSVLRSDAQIKCKQKTMDKKNLVLCLFSFLFSLIVSAQGGSPPVEGEMDMPARPWVTRKELPDFKAMAATRQGSRHFAKSDLLGKVWVADFIFTNCGSICPRMTRKMRGLQDRLPPEVMLVSFTIDPANDTLKVLEAHAREYDADPQRWFFVRMSERGIRKLMKSSFERAATNKASYEQNAAPGLSHNSRFALVDAGGGVRAFYDAFDENALGQLADAVERLLQEKNLPNNPQKRAIY
jgi:protein SCO1/2